MDKVTQAKEFAIKAHADVNQKYDTMPYSYHLDLTVKSVERYIHLIPESEREYVLMAAWLHDTIEDARVTYNDIKKEFGEIVAEYVFALTNEKGRTRAERANDKYYQGIVDYRYAKFVKMCDRIANVYHSFIKGSGMFIKYQKEHKNFKEKLYDPYFQEIWDYMDKQVS
jgi:(p)ppGpp synthase/HD superfamily hydrolase